MVFFLSSGVSILVSQNARNQLCDEILGNILYFLDVLYCLEAITRVIDSHCRKASALSLLLSGSFHS